MLIAHLSIEKPVIKTTAFMIHEIRSMGQGSRDIKVTRHAVLSLDGRPHIGAGNEISTTDLHVLLQLTANQKPTPCNLLPPNLLGLGPDYLSWFVPGKVRPMWFLGGNGKQIRYEVPWPNLVFVVKKNKLTVVSYKGKGRPHGKTRLFHAPIGNVYNDGQVCTGSATLPREGGVDSMSGWESVIFDTMFSHVNHENTLVLSDPAKNKAVTNRQHLQFWKKQVGSGVFPNRHLTPLRVTLEEFLA